MVNDNGNRNLANGVTATFDNQDRLLSFGAATYTYTENGERKTKTSGGATTTYTHDALGNLVQVSLPNGTLIEYLLDGRQRRVGKKVNGVLGQGFLYEDQLRPAAELDGTGAVVSRFVYGEKANVPEYMIRGGNTYRLITDSRGSPRLVINVQTGAIEQRMDYTAYGAVILDTSPGFQPFGFAGGLYDRDSRLAHFGARDYDPETGAWLSKDPLKFDGGVTNLYEYVGANPINYTDPLGLQQMPFTIPGGVDPGRIAQAMACAQNPAACRPPPGNPGCVCLNAGSILGGFLGAGAGMGVLIGAGHALHGMVGAVSGSVGFIGGAGALAGVFDGMVAFGLVGGGVGVVIAGAVIVGGSLLLNQCPPDQCKSCP